MTSLPVYFGFVLFYTEWYTHCRFMLHNTKIITVPQINIVLISVMNFRNKYNIQT